MLRFAGLALCLVACGFGRDVGQAGAYEAASNTHITDTATYPLQTLLVVEHDLRVQQARLYCFTGNLGRADVGLEDMRRIARRFNGFAMAFETPQDAIETSDQLDAGVDDADAGPITGHGDPLTARVGERSVTLIRLDDKGLFRSGASRYLTAVRTTEYSVSAYVGVLEAGEMLEEIAIDALGVSYAGSLPSAMPELTRTDALIGFGYTTRADFLVFELAQGQERKADASHVDAMVRTVLAPGTPYALSPALLTDVASQGCWSSERPIEARIHQVSRSYQQRPAAAGGDWAVSYERTEVVKIPAEEWTLLLGMRRPIAYCDTFK